MPEKRETEFVCAGRRWNQTKVTYEWYDLQKDPEFKTPLYFGKLKSYVGMIHTATVEADGEKTYATLGKFVRRLEDTEKGAEWEAQDRAAGASKRLASDVRKAKEFDYIEEALAPIRRAYKTSDPIAREVIIARVIHAIKKW
jgi:hypothetical protein